MKLLTATRLVEPAELDHCPGYPGNTNCPVAVQVLMETSLE